jgi:hypothetical protein
MKKLVLVALMAAFMAPVSAQAAETKFVGGPLTNLESQGATINLTLSNVPAKGGLYLMQCVEGLAGARPTLCNKAVELWISAARGASFLPTDAIKFKPTGSFVSGATTVDCTVEKCGIFIRFDHTVASDLSEDQFIPLTFKAATTSTVALPNDEITATINGVAVSTRSPITLTYRQFATVSATAKSGAKISFATLAPACALNGTEITPLSGVGECAISVTSAGNENFAGVTAILPIRLALGVQTVGDFTVPKSMKVGKKFDLPTLSNFGEKVSYKATGACSISKAKASFKKGKCTITATAPAKANSYKALKIKYSITSR